MDGVYNSTAPVYYGLAYPDYGTLILDGKMLDQQLISKLILDRVQKVIIISDCSILYQDLAIDNESSNK
jgi:hypothetical protein